MIFFDTESVGMSGPLMTIQYSAGKGSDVILHEVWRESIQSTLDIIQTFCEEGICGFNLVHDWFMLSKWYNVFRQVTNKELTPWQTFNEIQNIEASGPHQSDVCLKPSIACDLMLLARSSHFQYLAKHKPLVLKKIPTRMLHLVTDTLQSSIQLPAGVRLSWAASMKKQLRHDVTDIIGKFEGLSTSLKHLYSVISGEEQTGSFDEEVGMPDYLEMPDWMPWGGNWAEPTRILMERFQHDERARDYAIRDVHYTYRLWEALGKPDGNDDDSVLACAVGGIHWKGFAVTDSSRIEVLAGAKLADKMAAPTSPAGIRAAIEPLLSKTELLMFTNTKKSTLEEIARWDGHPAQAVAKASLKAKQGQSRLNTLQKLHRAGRFCFSMKVAGTLSSRMSGGAEGGEGGMNAQGIPREKEFRSLFPLAFDGERLEGGDFDAFEVSIADALYHDSQLAIDIRSGKKFHAITGSVFYNTDYTSILHSKGTLNDKYTRAKNGFFAYLYGATPRKLGQVLDVTEEEAEIALMRLAKRYPQIKEHRNKLAERFSPVWQEEGIGSKINWREPDEYIESILGFRRYFTLEWAVVKALYKLQENPPDSWGTVRGDIRRTDRSQTYSGAARSALFGGMFSISSAVFRAAANHEIQSPGGQITKRMQVAIWSHQPIGIGPWIVRPLNVHDEILTPTILSGGRHSILNETVQSTVQSYHNRIPMLKMEWGPMKDWSDK